MQTTTVTAALAFLALPSVALAQFGDDPSTPAVIAQAASEQVQPKVVAIPSGGFYVSWYDNRAGGYDPWVQRFDADGRGMWPGGGVQVIDTSFSSTEDYGLTIDAAGNAVVVTRADAGGLRIIAQAVSPEGSLLWGPSGVTVSTTSSVNSPKAGRAGDGAAVAGWTEGSRAKVMRMNADGTKAWAAAATVSDGTATTILSDLQPGDGDSVIASVVRYTTFTGAKTLQAQKFSGAGTAQWTSTNVRVFTTGSLQFGNFPSFIPDGAGGAVFAWYTSSPLQCSVQWVAANGTLKFGTNGSTVTTTTTNNRVDPAVTVDAANQRVWASWSQQVPNTSIFGVGVQAFDASGARQLGDSGAMLAPMETVYQFVQNRACMLDGAPTFSFTKSTAFGANVIYAQALAADATPLWATDTQVCSSGTVGRPVLAPMSGATPWAAVVWETGGTGAADLVAQRLNADGSLGPVAAPPVLGDLNGDSVVNGVDLGILLGAWGSSDAAPDLNEDGVVNGADLGIMLGNWSA
jgi:hypothetical protein